ncbi:MAG: hypothetical protein ACK4N5_01875 [Myxococcales bacterium]
MKKLLGTLLASTLVGCMGGAHAQRPAQPVGSQPIDEGAVAGQPADPAVGEGVEDPTAVGPIDQPAEEEGEPGQRSLERTPRTGVGGTGQQQQRGIPQQGGAAQPREHQRDADMPSPSVQGRVMNVDPRKGTLTIRDEQRGASFTLTVEDTSVVRIGGIDVGLMAIPQGSEVRASYFVRDGELVAQDIDARPGRAQPAEPQRQPADPNAPVVR